MRFANILSVALFGALTFGAAPGYADPDDLSRAAALSAVLGGTLNSDIGEAGSLLHSVDNFTVVVRPGRSAEYRQRVALEMQMVGRSSASISLATSDRSRVARSSTNN